MLQVRWSRPAESETMVRSCVPWPWGVAGVGLEPPGSAFERLAGKPILWFWLGARPAGEPHQPRVHQSWRDLVADVAGCIGRGIGGVSLAPNRGLVGPDGRLVLSPELEGLLSSSPIPLPASTESTRRATRAVERHGLPIQVRRAGLTAWAEQR